MIIKSKSGVENAAFTFLNKVWLYKLQVLCAFKS